MKTILTKKLINEMRQWIFDCCRDQDDIDSVIEWTDDYIVRYVKRNYDGSVDGFIAAI